MPAAQTSRGAGSPAVEDYLEQIFNLINSKGYARVIDIAKNLGISQASVTNMIQRLDAEGLLIYEKYRGMVLTARGEEIAEAISQRHQVLTRLLQIFDIEEDTLYRVVEGMEHHVSPPTLELFRALAEELEADPKLVKRLRARMSEAQ
jgi:Mn-dependent DtxR family transcriptional regulator